MICLCLNGGGRTFTDSQGPPELGKPEPTRSMSNRGPACGPVGGYGGASIRPALQLQAPEAITGGRAICKHTGVGHSAVEAISAHAGLCLPNPQSYRVNPCVDLARQQPTLPTPVADGDTRSSHIPSFFSSLPPFNKYKYLVSPALVGPGTQKNVMVS